MAAPMIAGVLSVPIYLYALGLERLGVLSLLMGLFGFSGIFDIGLSRALTHAVSLHRGMETSDGAIFDLCRRAIIWTGILGLAWGGACALLTGPIVRQFSIPESLVIECTHSLYVLSLLIPISLVTTSLSGVIEGYEQFEELNRIRIPLSLVSGIVPAISAIVWPSVLSPCISLLLIRLIGLAQYSRTVQGMISLSGGPFRRIPATGLLKFSGWLSVSNLVAPLMAYGDRYYLATIFPPFMVARYTVPLDTLFRATAFPMSVMSVLFPSLSANAHTKGFVYRRVYHAVLAYACLWWIPIFIASIWIEPIAKYTGLAASDSVHVVFWVASAVLLNGTALFFYTIVQSTGDAETTAKFHAFEFLFYVPLLVFLVKAHGILGAAVAWYIRVLVDTVLLAIKVAVRFSETRTPTLVLASGAVSMSALILLNILLVDEQARMLFTSVFLILWLWAFWRMSEKVAITRLFRRT